MPAVTAPKVAVLQPAARRKAALKCFQTQLGNWLGQSSNYMRHPDTFMSCFLTPHFTPRKEAKGTAKTWRLD